jgi:HD-GYP domain-containing protein (c-di-GMP phosphodiesterase class II)
VSRGPSAIPSNLKALLAGVSLLALMAAATAVFSPSGAPVIGGTAGGAFWVLVVALGSASVRMPGGAVVDVGVAPVLAASILGGPQAAVVVSVIGTLEWREVRGLLPGKRGGVPWYGTVYNHSSVLIPSVVVAWAYAIVIGPSFQPDLRSLVVLIGLGVVHVSINNFLTALAIALRENRSVRSVLVANVRQFGVSLAGLAPLAWLMAAMYVVAGPIGVLPFAVPLYATRAGYKKVVEIRDMFTQTVRSLAGAVDAKDPYTAGHSERVQRIGKDLGAELNCSDTELEALEWGGLLHDIGKIGIPDAVLLKEGALTKEERVIMNAHPVKGEEIIRPVAKLAPELPIIRHHHEWYNGSGYPDRLVGHDIPKLARILHVADSYEAMTAARPYRMTPLTQMQALDELHKFSGIQFDPEVVAAFDRLIARNPEWIKPNIPEGLRQRHIPRLGEAEVGPLPA